VRIPCIAGGQFSTSGRTLGFNENTRLFAYWCNDASDGVFLMFYVRLLLGFGEP